MHRTARISPDSYHGTLPRDGVPTSVIELALAHDLPPILERHGDLAVCADGVHVISQGICIPGDVITTCHDLDCLPDGVSVRTQDLRAALTAFRSLAAQGEVNQP